MLFYRFSREQRFPTFLAIFGIIFFWTVLPIVMWIYYKNTIDTFFEFIYRLIPYWILAFSVTVLYLIIICWCGIACHTVVFADDGVAIANRKGKRFRYLAWKDIQIYTVAINTITYVCLSTNSALPDFRKKIMA